MNEQAMEDGNLTTQQLEDVEHMCGVPYHHLQAISEDWKCSIASLFVTMTYLRIGTSQHALAGCLRGHLDLSRQTLRRLMAEATSRCPTEGACYPEARFMWKDPEWPMFTGAVDGVPIYCRGSAEHYNGKHSTKYVSFQVIVDLVGRPFAWSPGEPGKVHDSLSFANWEWIKDNHAHCESWFADTAYLACSHCVTPLKKNMNSIWNSVTATQSEKETFEILHRKRRNRVEHYFAKLRMFNFKFDGCELRTSSIKVYFNFLMHVLSRSMMLTTREEGKWNYDHLVVFRPYSEVELFHQCTCRMNDRQKTMVKTRDCFVRYMADHYAGKPLENRRSQKSSKASEKTYTPRSRASQQAQFAKEMEDSGAKWAAKKGKGKVLPKAVAVASKRAREDTDSDSSSSQSDSYNSSDSSSSDSDTPAMAPQKAAPKTVLKVKAWVLPPASAPPGPSK